MEQYPIAYRIPLEKLKEGIFNKGEGWNSSHVLINETKVFRVNIIGTVISKDDLQRFPQCIIDDGTSHIQVRSFEPTEMFRAVEMGDLVRVIGNVRQYGNDIYLVPLCMRKVRDRQWIELHKKDAHIWTPSQKDPGSQKAQEMLPDSYVDILRSMDKGTGVSLQEFKKHITQQPADKVIQDLLSQGEIFEIRPGFVKALY